MDFYYKTTSSGCRAVLMTAKSIGVKLNLKSVDFYKKANFASELLQVNPKFNIPTLVDKGIVLTEPRTIMIYLLDKYADESHILKPTNVYNEAEINQLLSFDLVNLYEPYKEMSLNKINGKSYDMSNIESSLSWLNSFLETKIFLTGDKISIADFSIFSSISNYQNSGLVKLSRILSIGTT